MAELAAPVTAAQRQRGRAFDLAVIIVVVTVIRIAALAIDFIPLSVDEAQYWIWAQQPAFGYFSKPPVIAWMIATTTAACGDGEACVRLSAPVTHALTTVVVFALGRVLFDRTTGWWSAVTYLLLPGVSVSARIVSTDVPLLLFWALALFCFVRACDTGRMRWWIGFGAALGLGFLSKYAMGLFVACAMIHVGWSPQVRRQISIRGVAAAAAIAAILVAPNAIWNLANDLPSLRHAATNLANHGAPLDLGRVVEFLGAQFVVFGPLTFAALAISTWQTARARRYGADRIILLISFSLPVIAAVAVEAFWARAHGNWAAPAYVAGTILVVRWALDRSLILLRASTAVHVALAVVVVALGPALGAFDTALPARFDPAWRERGWDRIGPWLADLDRRYPDAVFLFDTRQAMAAAIYYYRPALTDAVMWNPSGKIHNHFEMISDVMRHVGDDLIYVTRQPDLGWIDGTFSEAVTLPGLTIATHRDRQLELHAHLIKGFKGYHP